PAGNTHLGVTRHTFDAVVDLRVQDHARAEIHQIALLLASRAEPHRGLAHSVRGDRADERCSRCDEAFDERRVWKMPRVVDRARVAALGGNELTKLGEATAI